MAFDEDLLTTYRDNRPLIQERVRSWKSLQDGILERLREFEDHPEISRSIYRTYCREDRQKASGAENPHIKSEMKIAEEIVLQRKGGHKYRLGRKTKIPPNPKFSLKDVDDILGVTIVTPFDSDIELVVARINSEVQKGRLIKVKDDKSHKRKSYSGHHLYLALPGDDYEGLVCEVQVKTAVQDAFSWKTHGLSYKPNAHTPSWFSDQFNRVIEVLRAADSISDQLRAQIENDKYVNIEKRKAARAGLIEESRRILASKISEKSDGLTPSVTKECKSILDELGRTLLDPELETFSVNRELQTRIGRVIETYELNPVTFRLACLIAVGDSSGLFFRRVEELYVDFIEALRRKYDRRKKVERTEFLNGFKSVALALSISRYCVGDCERASRAATRFLEEFPTEKSSPSVARAHSNIAYFNSEMFRWSGDPKHQDAAKEALIQARSMFGDVVPDRDRDTFGYVAIETGDTIEEVEGGLELCRAAYEAVDSDGKASSDDKALAELFFQIHREAAYRRLATLSSH